MGGSWVWVQLQGPPSRGRLYFLAETCHSKRTDQHNTFTWSSPFTQSPIPTRFQWLCFGMTLKHELSENSLQVGLLHGDATSSF